MTDPDGSGEDLDRILGKLTFGEEDVLAGEDGIHVLITLAWRRKDDIVVQMDWIEGFEYDVLPTEPVSLTNNEGSIVQFRHARLR